MCLRSGSGATVRRSQPEIRRFVRGCHDQVSVRHRHRREISSATEDLRTTARVDYSLGDNIMKFMVFDLHVIYKSPSTEWLFLGVGWGGVRDVRGVYLSASAAEIVINNWALLPEIASTIKLTLSVSNRCEVDALFVRATGAFGSAQTFVKRNGAAILTMCEIFADPIHNHTTIVLEPTFGPSSAIAKTAGTLDIVAIDELQITR